ncbi:MAG: hypothetical protein KFF46_06770 [Desulfobacterales bacterium]|nr:hypothetical protein [Desulfobacterales bacterium]
MNPRNSLKCLPAALLLILTFLICAGPAAAESRDQTSGEKVKQDIAEAIESMKQYSAAKQEEMAKRAKEEISRMDERIDELERRYEKEKSEMSKEMKEKSRSTLQTLREKRDDLVKWAEKFKNSSEDAWEGAKQGFSKAWRDFQRSLEDTEDKSAKETRI